MITKRPGADWEVIFQYVDGLYGSAAIFGLNDFRHLDAELESALPDDVEVVQIKRVGFDEATAAFWEDEN